jgi:hypothetical protein
MDVVDRLIWLRIQKMEGSCGHGVEVAGFKNAMIFLTS